MPERSLCRVYGVLWAVVVVLEAAVILWESCSGRVAPVEWTGVLPLYPCSIFLYAMPFAVWGKGEVRRAACGYLCALGLLGGVINFMYPANVLSHYSCISFPGMYTFFYHGTLVFVAVTMLLTGYHRYCGARRFSDLLVPSVPCLLVSPVANAVNFSPVDADYMSLSRSPFSSRPLVR